MLKAAGPYIGFPFDHVISVEEAGYFKPHWKTYAKAEEIIGHDRSSILFVANHAFDCIGAKSYGMRTAFIDRRKRNAPPTLGQHTHEVLTTLLGYSSDEVHVLAREGVV